MIKKEKIRRESLGVFLLSLFFLLPSMIVLTVFGVSWLLHWEQIWEIILAVIVILVCGGASIYIVIFTFAAAKGAIAEHRLLQQAKQSAQE